MEELALIPQSQFDTLVNACLLLRAAFHAAAPAPASSRQPDLHHLCARIPRQDPGNVRETSDSDLCSHCDI